MGLRARPEPVINGLGESGSRVSLDGADLTNDVTSGMLFAPPLSALNELRVTTSGGKADQGRAASAAVQLVSKAGTNSWRGTASFFRRGDELSAMPVTYDRNGAAPSFGRWQYSGALGGPVIRDRIFWFGSFEYLQQNSLLQAGERDTVARAIRNGLTTVPLASRLGLARADWNISDRDNLTILYAAERSEGDDLSTLQRTLASASQRQHFNETFDQGWLNYTRSMSPTLVANLRLGFSGARVGSAAAANGLQFNFPGLQAGAPFRAPSLPRHNRWQLQGSLSKIAGTHAFSLGGEMQRINAEYALGFARSGAIEFAENFASADRNGDGRVDDNDLLFTVALRNVSLQERAARLRNTYLAAFLQDDWRIRPRLTLNLGARWQFDTNEKNLSGYADLNPILRPFLRGERASDKNNFAPRAGFVWAFANDRFVMRGGYSLFFDRIPLQYSALEQTLDGRHAAIAVTGGNLSLLSDGRFAINAPTTANPFVGANVLWPNAPGLNILDNSLQSPMTQQASLEFERLLTNALSVRAGYLHSFGAHFLVGRSLGAVANPLTGAHDRVVNLESSAKTKYDALNLSVEKRSAQGWQFFANYTFSKSFNYTNGDQVPFFAGMVDPGNPRLEYGPSPFDQRHRFSFSGEYEFWRGLRAAAVWTMASGTPMDILLPDASARVPQLQRNAGGRLFHTGAELNQFLSRLNAAGGVNGTPLPLVSADARFNDGFQSFDLRLSNTFRLGGDARLEFGAELLNLFNVTNILGWSNLNYTGFANALTRDSANPAEPGYLRASGFGRPLTTAGRLFTAGAPRSAQLMVKFSF
jgi:outer membrane receptor protein involved in Fe transport